MRAEAFEQRLQLADVAGGPLVVQPFPSTWVEALELAERLGVRGRGADQLDTVQAAGEVGAVIRQQLPGQPVSGAGGDKAGPDRVAAERSAGVRDEQVAGVVIDDVDHPDALAPTSFTCVASICQRSLATGRSNRFFAGRRASSARILRARQRGCSLRNAQIACSSRGSIRPGDVSGRRGRPCKPSMPPAR
jgi:hypothetical protein